MPAPLVNILFSSTNAIDPLASCAHVRFTRLCSILLLILLPPARCATQPLRRHPTLASLWLLRLCFLHACLLQFEPAQVSRFLVSLGASGLPVTLALNKADLLPAAEIQARLDQVGAGLAPWCHVYLALPVKEAATSPAQPRQQQQQDCCCGSRAAVLSAVHMFRLCTCCLLHIMTGPVCGGLWGQRSSISIAGDHRSTAAWPPTTAAVAAGMLHVPACLPAAAGCQLGLCCCCCQL